MHTLNNTPVHYDVIHAYRSKPATIPILSLLNTRSFALEAYFHSLRIDRALILALIEIIGIAAAIEKALSSIG